MSWLDDIASRRKREGEEKAEAIRQSKVDTGTFGPIVYNLLKEVGRAYWESYGEKCVINRSFGRPRWEVGKERGSSEYWGVELKKRGEDDYFFEVEGHNGTTATEHATEADLKEALRAAVQSGPASRRTK